MMAVQLPPFKFCMFCGCRQETRLDLVQHIRKHYQEQLLTVGSNSKFPKQDDGEACKLCSELGNDQIFPETEDKQSHIRKHVGYFEQSSGVTVDEQKEAELGKLCFPSFSDYQNQVGEPLQSSCSMKKEIAGDESLNPIMKPCEEVLGEEATKNGSSESCPVTPGLGKNWADCTPSGAIVSVPELADRQTVRPSPSLSYHQDQSAPSCSERHSYYSGNDDGNNPSEEEPVNSVYRLADTETTTSSLKPGVMASATGRMLLHHVIPMNSTKGVSATNRNLMTELRLGSEYKKKDLFWTEVEKVAKGFLLKFFKRGIVTKEEYKSILKFSVPKIVAVGRGSTEKIRQFLAQCVKHELRKRSLVAKNNKSTRG